MLRYAFLAIFSCLPLLAAAQPTPTQVHGAVKQAGGAEKFLMEMARKTAPNLPQMTNQNLQIKSIAASGRRLAYTAILVNIDKRKGQDIEDIRRQSISYLACNSPTLGILIRQYDVEIVYFYTARNTDFLFQNSLNRQSCQGR